MPLEWHTYPIEFNSMVVLELVLLSVIAAAAHIATTKTATTAPTTRTFQDAVVFLGPTSVAGSAGTVVNVAVAIVPAWHQA